MRSKQQHGQEKGRKSLLQNQSIVFSVTPTVSKNIAVVFMVAVLLFRVYGPKRSQGP